MKRFALILFLLSSLLAQNKIEDHMKYFESPQKAVQQIKEMLLKEDWENLLQFYYLENSSYSYEDLQGANFFLNANPPEVHHPTDLVRYKRPFDPSYSYDYFEESGDTITVWLRKEIDQGGGNLQVGITSFQLISREGGYSILP